MSRQALDRLDPAERRAALTHELLHARHRDPLTGWALMIWRLVFWFNPVVQILARAVVVDLEQRADEQAAAITTDPAAMSSALLKLFRAATGVSDGAGPALWEPVFLQRLRRLQIRHIEGRCRALLKTRAAVSAPGVAQAVVAALAVAALLVVVV